MLLVVIDALEKILAWLRPFSVKEEQISKDSKQDFFSTRLAADVLGDVPSSANQTSLIAALQTLIKDRAKNVEPKVVGYLAVQGGGPIFCQKKANVTVWLEFYRNYGNLCDVHWTSP